MSSNRREFKEMLIEDKVRLQKEIVQTVSKLIETKGVLGIKQKSRKNVDKELKDNILGFGFQFVVVRKQLLMQQGENFRAIGRTQVRKQQ